MFDRGVVASLLFALHAIRSSKAGPLERNALLLGLAAIVEASSNAIKDGRALRIAPDRKRTPLVAASAPRRFRDPVKQLLAQQYEAMAQDLARWPNDQTSAASATPLFHLRGDARRLRGIVKPNGEPAFPSESVDVAIFSPPYLNFIDYSEVYKLELWLLGLVKDHAAFADCDLEPSAVTHPSGSVRGQRLPLLTLLCLISYTECRARVLEHGTRPEVAPIIRQYFDDMYYAYREQARVIKPGGVSVCVVANSTFSRRESWNGEHRERWRIPLLTDVLLAHVARFAGFETVELWRARDLTPRNIQLPGLARESLVVARTAP